MQRFLATLLMLCLGVLVPVVASPMRVCLLENLVLVAEIETDGTCCDDCEREDGHPGDCCVDLDVLPDSSIPDSSVNAPPLVVIDLPRQIDTLAPRTSDPLRPRMADIAESGTWPPPSARRALLGVWRL